MKRKFPERFTLALKTILAIGLVSLITTLSVPLAMGQSLSSLPTSLPASPAPLPPVLSASVPDIAGTPIPRPVAEITPGWLMGYLPPDVFQNSIRFLPPPPAQGSPALALDQEIAKRAVQIRGTNRWEMAAGDANLTFPQAANRFSCALGMPITETDTPRLYLLLQRTLIDASQSTLAAKQYYQRPRPFLINHEPICDPQQQPELAQEGAYPSGHTAIGWAWALILSEIAPERTDALLARGRVFGENRIACNVHWHSDVVEGRFMGAATVTRLHTQPAFLADLEAAKAEYAAAQAKNLSLSRNCEEEALASRVAISQ